MDIQSFQDKRKLSKPNLTKDIGTNRIRNEISKLKINKNKSKPNHELQRNFFASLEIPNLGR